MSTYLLSQGLIGLAAATVFVADWAGVSPRSLVRMVRCWWVLAAVTLCVPPAEVWAPVGVMAEVSPRYGAARVALSSLVDRAIEQGSPVLFGVAAASPSFWGIVSGVVLFLALFLAAGRILFGLLPTFGLFRRSTLLHRSGRLEVRLGETTGVVWLPWRTVVFLHPGLTPAERVLAARHEAAHLRNRDPLWV